MQNVYHALLVRDFMTAYGRSPLSVLWAVAEPVIGIALLTLVFSQISHVAPMGSSYPLFYATGYLPYLFFTSIQGKAMNALKQSKATMSHAKITFVDIIFVKVTLQALIMTCVMVIVYGGIWWIYQPPERMDVSLMGLFFVLGVFLGTGIGVMNAGLAAVFPPWEKVWGVLMRPLFLISGVFYPFSAMPPSLQDILWWNPVLHLVGMNRQAVYQGYESSYISLMFLLVVSLISATLGFALLRLRKH